MYRNKVSGSSTNAEDCENRSQLRQRDRNSYEEFEELIRRNICNPKITRVLDKIFETFSDSESDACQLNRRKLVESALKELAKVNVSSGQTNTIVNRIISDIPGFSKQHLVKLVEFCITNIRNDTDPIHSWKDLLPVLLETLENEKYIVLSHGEVSGKEYKDIIVKEICEAQWDIHILPPLTKMFGDIALDKTRRSLVLRTLCSNLPRLPLDQVPSFVYQVLKLCKDKDNHKFLIPLSKYFETCYSKTVVISNDAQSFEEIGTISIKDIRENENTVLYHIYQAPQLNHNNMRDFIRFIKQISYAPEHMLQPFMLAVSMTISSIYEDQIYKTLRIVIANDNSEKLKRECSAWLRQLLPSPCNIIEIIRQVIENSNQERHLILKGLTDLAFVLMKVEQKSKNNTTMWSIGSDIIREIIKKCHETVPVVLQELINNIVSGDTSTTHYTDCLKYACRKLSMIILDHQALIMTILEQLLSLPSTVASQVLNAISPLMHVSANIRENVILILRKALYHKGVSKRQMAVTGFLEMLKYSKMYSRAAYRLSQCSSSSFSSRSLTQATLESNSQRERSTSEFDKSLCYEILAILKKCFSYEFEVRLHLYEGLYNAVAKNPDIVEIIIDMFLSHLNLFIETDDNILPPIKFDLCMGIQGTEVVLHEPIGQLIFALQKIYTNSNTRYLSVFEKLHDTLELLCEGMAATQLEHLNMENGIDEVHEDFPKPQKKLKTLDASLAVYESLMAYCIGKCSKENANRNQITKLFRGYTRLIDFVKRQSMKAKKADSSKTKKDKDTNNTTIKKSAKLNDIKVSNTIMDLTVIRESLSLLFSQSLTTDDNELRKDQNFCCYILKTCEQLLQHSRPFINDPFHTKDKQCLNTYIDIGRLLYQNFLLHLEDAFSENEQATVLALQCFKEISYWMCTSISSELPAFLDSILGRQSAILQNSSSHVNFQLEEIILSLKPHLRAALVEEAESEEKKKLAPLLLEIVKQFSYKIDFNKYASDKVLQDIRKILEEADIQTSNVSAVVQFFLELEEHAREYGETLNNICLELCEKVGTIDGTDLETEGQYKIIRDDTILPIYNALNNHIKEKLNNSSCVLQRLKAEDIIIRETTDDETCINKLKEKERHVCKHLSYLAQVLHTLANTAIKSISCTDATFKNLYYLYHLLGNLTKYFYARSSSQNAAFQAVKFIQAVQLAGKPLKTAFYNLVAHVEENQNESNSKADMYAQRNKILKETKIIPRVVYEIEQFNQVVLLLGKRTSIPLENYIRHSVTRDFRIKNPQLVEGLDRLDTSLLTGTCADNTTNEDNINTSHTNETDSDSSTEDTSSSKRSRMED